MSNIVKQLMILFFIVTVSACGGNDGGGGNSGETDAPETVPDDPALIEATTLSESSITLTWDDNSDNEEGFRVERSLSPDGGFAEVATTGADEIIVNDNGLDSDTTYYYRVVAFNSVGDSGYSEVMGATTDASANSPPAAPTDLQASVFSSSEIRLTWVDQASNESGYVIWHAAYNVSTLTCGAFSVVGGALSADTVSYAHQSLSPSSAHCYRVEAINSIGSAVSNIVEGVLTLPVFTLRVSKSGSGTGTVTGTGVDCGSDCSQSFDSNTSVTLTATASGSSSFLSWSGCDSIRGTTRCSVTMTGNRTVIASFDDINL